MKKISLKMIRKSLNIKGKEDGDFVMLQQPSLAAEFTKDDSVFGGCYTKALVGCDLNVEDEKGYKNRSKSESLMGTLKRRLSTKQKAKVKGGPSAVGSGDDDDSFSSSSVPISFNEVKAQRPLRSSSLRSHHYSPSPWPFRPVSSEEACIKMEVKLKAMVHSPNLSPSLNGIRKEIHDVQLEGLFQDQRDSLKDMEAQSGNLHLNIEDHVPIGLTPQDYIQYTMPLDDGMYPGSSQSFCLDVPLPMEVVDQVESNSLHMDQAQDDLMPSDILMDQSVNGHLPGTPSMVFSNSRADTPLFSPSLSPLSTIEIPRTLSGFSGADSHVVERVRHHLNFDPSSAPGVSRVYDSFQNSGPMVVTSLTEELKKLAKQGWYWGPITRWEAEEKLINLPDGSFLVRDSSDDRYLLSLSFRSQGKTLHTRIEHSNGRFSFYEQPDIEGHTSIVDLIEHSIKDSENGAFCYSRSRLPGSVTYPVRLTNPVSRFMQVRSLQYLCRFVIRQYTRIDLIQKLPLPNKMKDYLQEKHY
ncbi:suppressor of cytokine signaling 6 [Myxocyprinus asiaticus]|uniref:suppressor of cytokine signaling 6 n=1 Tax=Myxocyprinus asiaticus TaxID=70543 RepID=UPI002222BE67|nr:suppressor of cytokine signaling 6 [Myxocyprinus asiaticus]